MKPATPSHIKCSKTLRQRNRPHLVFGFNFRLSAKLKIYISEWEWSAWSQCSQSCGKGGVETRIARCVDNGLLEECLMASRQNPPKTESRPCKRQTCPPSPQSGWIPVK